MKIDTISVTEANREGIPALIAAANEGRHLVISRENQPTAAIVDFKTMERLQRLDELEDDLRLLVIALFRTWTDPGKRYDLNDVAAEFGIDLDEA